MKKQDPRDHRLPSCALRPGDNVIARRGTFYDAAVAQRRDGSIAHLPRQAGVVRSLADRGLEGLVVSSTIYHDRGEPRDLARRWALLPECCPEQASCSDT